MFGIRLASGMGTALLALIALCPMSHSTEADATGQPTTLGLTVASLDGELLDRLAYRSGVLVTAVSPGGLAEQAGIEKGDVLVVVGSVTLRNVEDLARAESEIVPGEPVSVVFSRNRGRLVKMIKLETAAQTAQETSLEEAEPKESPPSASDAPTTEAGEEVVLPETSANESPDAPLEPADEPLESAPESTPAPAARMAPEPSSLSSGSPPPGGALAALGLRCEDLSPDLAAALGMPRGRGALVLHVADRSPAAMAGVRAGDVITRAGEQTIWGVEHLSNALRVDAGTLSLGLRRRGAERSVEVALAAPASEPVQVVEEPVAAPDDGIRSLREEVRSLRREVQRLREEVEGMRSREPL